MTIGASESAGIIGRRDTGDLGFAERERRPVHVGMRPAPEISMRLGIRKDSFPPVVADGWKGVFERALGKRVSRRETNIPHKPFLRAVSPDMSRCRVLKRKGRVPRLQAFINTCLPARLTLIVGIEKRPEQDKKKENSS